MRSHIENERWRAGLGSLLGKPIMQGRLDREQLVGAVEDEAVDLASERVSTRHAAYDTIAEAEAAAATEGFHYGRSHPRIRAQLVRGDDWRLCDGGLLLRCALPAGCHTVGFVV